MQRDFRFVDIFLPCMLASSLAGCDFFSGDDSDDVVTCRPEPRISSSPPRDATVGTNYSYSVDARWVCIPFICDNVVAVKLPSGATIDNFFDSISWTPSAGHANKDVEFEIRTGIDSCGDSASQSWKVKVLPAPEIASFTSDRVTVSTGEDVNLRAVFSHGFGEILGYGSVTSGKPLTVKNLLGTTTFKLIVSNMLGASVTSSIVVEVLQPPVIQSFTASKPVITRGEGVTLSWSIAGNFSSLTLDPVGAVAASATSIGVRPTESTDYRLIAANALATDVSDTVRVEVVPAAAIQSFTVAPESTILNGSVALTAIFDGGTSELQRMRASGWETFAALDSATPFDPGPITRNERYRLVVTNQLGAWVDGLLEVPIFGPGTFQVTGGGSPHSTGRYRSRAVRLPDGKVFVAGGFSRDTEIYDPLTGVYTTGPSQPERRERFGMALMADGRVLLAGGNEVLSGPILTARIYDPVANTLIPTTSLPAHAVNVRNALTLPDGRVLLYHQNSLSSSGGGEGIVLFDPSTASYTSAPPMKARHLYPHIHLLDDGRVVFLDGQAPEASEIYDPVSNTFERLGSMLVERSGFVSAKLNDGRIFVAGGGTDTVEIFDPASGSFSLLASTTIASTDDTAVTLPDGKVLIAGGAHSEIFDPVTGTFAVAGGVIEFFDPPSLTVLEDGRVLKTGGCSCPGEIFTR